jgi:phospholipase C
LIGSFEAIAVRFIIYLFIALLCSCSATSFEKQNNNQSAKIATQAIQHIVVIYLENHSFNNLYGLFPNANGLEQANSAAPQTDLDGKPYASLPQVKNVGYKHAEIDIRFPNYLPNKPFLIDQYVAADQKTGDLVHRFYQNQAQINGGLNDRFAAVSDAGGLVMGYYDGHQLPLWQYAKKYTLADNFFQGAFGGSFLNHFWLACACTPRYENAPEELQIKLDGDGKLLKDGQVIDGFVVNTLQPTAIPFYPNTKLNKQLPPQNMPTIGDRLSDKNISWAWYAGGWNDASAGKADKNFQFHHQPYVYFSRYAEGTVERTAHLKDETDFIKAIETGTLPAVSFYKPIGALNEHPGYADLISVEQHIADLLARIEASSQWKNTLVIVTYDENGGFWDHVAPPKKDRWGPSTRVPTLIISPFAKRGFVDHTEYDTTSILKLIETRFSLKPLTDRDADANNFSNALVFKTSG